MNKQGKKKKKSKPNQDFIYDIRRLVALYGLDCSLVIYHDGRKKVKPMGDFYQGSWGNGNCPRCGTKLRTDGQNNWCSSINCEYMEGIQ